MRGVAARDSLLRARAQTPGYFSDRVRANMLREIGPSPQSVALPAESQIPDPLIYLREHGAYGDDQELGVCAYAVATALGALWRGSVQEATDTLSLLLVSLEQASMDGGSMELGAALLFLPDPPTQAMERRQSLNSFRQFPRLAEQHWISTVLSFLEGLDAISSRRALWGVSKRKPRGQRQRGKVEEEDIVPKAKAPGKK